VLVLYWVHIVLLLRCGAIGVPAAHPGFELFPFFGHKSDKKKENETRSRGKKHTTLKKPSYSRVMVIVVLK
jgi:hypothetical protein